MPPGGFFVCEPTGETAYANRKRTSKDYLNQGHNALGSGNRKESSRRDVVRQLLREATSGCGRPGTAAFLVKKIPPLNDPAFVAGFFISPSKTQ
jgi:hypothetical protein